MQQPALIAETPRAGTVHHRFFVSASEIDSAQAAVFVSAARTCTPLNPGSTIARCVGVNYLAVRRSVVQETSQRLGVEMLVLVGTQTSELSEAHRQRCFEQLESRLLELNSVFAESNWERADRVVICHPTLTRWARDDFASIPSVRLSPPNKRSLWFKLLIGLGWAVVFLLLIATFWQPR